MHMNFDFLLAFRSWPPNYDHDGTDAADALRSAAHTASNKPDKLPVRIECNQIYTVFITSIWLDI